MKKSVYVLGAVLSLSFVVSAEDVAVTATPATAPAAVAPAAPTIEVVKSALGSGVDRETRTIQGEATDGLPR